MARPVPVSVLTDGLVEGNATVTLPLQARPNYSIGNGSATVYIDDNELARRYCVQHVTNDIGDDVGNALVLVVDGHHDR